MFRLILKLKFAISKIILKSPYSLYLAWLIMPRLEFLLPHDRAFYGFRHFARDPRGLILDVGANNGISSLSLNKILPGMPIHAIEANPLHIPALEWAKKRIGTFSYSIRGAGESRSSLTLYTPFFRSLPMHANTSSDKDYIHHALARILSPRALRHVSYRQHDIDVIPIDEMALAPSIVKIDTEGFDFFVLKGMRQTLEKHRPVVMFEFSPGLGDDFVTFFEDLKYALYLYDYKLDCFRPFVFKEAASMWHDDALNINPFAIPSEMDVPPCPVGDENGR